MILSTGFRSIFLLQHAGVIPCLIKAEVSSHLNKKIYTPLLAAGNLIWGSRGVSPLSRAGFNAPPAKASIPRKRSAVRDASLLSLSQIGFEDTRVFLDLIEGPLGQFLAFGHDDDRVT
jgi:hypothetical protein